MSQDFPQQKLALKLECEGTPKVWTEKKLPIWGASKWEPYALTMKVAKVILRNFIKQKIYGQ